MSRLKETGRRAYLALLRHLKRVIWTGQVAEGSIAPSWEAISDLAASLDQTDLQTALLLHEAVLRQRPNSGSAHYRMGRALVAATRGPGSLPHLRKALEIEPSHGPHWSAYLDKLLEFETSENALEQISALPEIPASAQHDAERALFFYLFRTGLGKEAVKYGRNLLGKTCTGMVFSNTGPSHYSVHLQFDGEGYKIIWGPLFLGWPFLLDRMLALIPYIDRLVVECRPTGTLQLTLGDMPDGEDGQLCFSGTNETHFLIPDGMFLASKGYADYHYGVQRSALPWVRRNDTLYWRGSLTGQAETFEEIFALPRILLAEKSKTRPDIDAKITDLSQFGPLLPQLQIMCEDRHLLGAREPETNNANYKYLIDIDGNTNSWPGLFTKLLTGSPVIKLKSKYRQWYYDKLKHGENIWLIDDLDSSLDHGLAHLRANPILAHHIGRAGADLAASLQPENQFSIFKERVLSLLEINRSKLALQS
jgi:tetratricopeptide (TPR) repeat protein